MSQPQPEPLDLAAIQACCDAATPGTWWNGRFEIYAGEPGDPSRSTWIGETCDVELTDSGEANAAAIAATHNALPVLLARVRELEAELAGMTDLRDRALARQDTLRAETARYRTAWHSAKARASNLRERLDNADHGRDRFVEALEQAQAALATAEAVAESNQRAAKLLAADVKRLTAEATMTPRERANAHVRDLLAAGDAEGAVAYAEAFEASEAYEATHPRL